MRSLTVRVPWDEDPSFQAGQAPARDLRIPAGGIARANAIAAAARVGGLQAFFATHRNCSADTTRPNDVRKVGRSFRRISPG